MASKRTRNHQAELGREASDPATAPRRLRELATGAPAVRRAIAANPNAPVELLLHLARWYWPALLENPVLPLLLLEDPGFPVRLPMPALRAMLKLPAPPPEFLLPLCRHPNEEIRAAARLHRARGESGGEASTAESSEVGPVKGGAALSEMLATGLAPDWVVQAAMEADNADLRQRAVSLVKPTPDDPIFRRLCTLREAGADHWLRFAGKPGALMEPSSLAALCLGGPFARILAARHPDTPPASLARLAELREIPAVRRLVAQNPSAPGATLIVLVSMGDERLRRAVAGNRACSPALLDTLAGDAQIEVRRSVAANRRVSPAALVRLAADAEAKVRQTVARHPALEMATLRTLARMSTRKCARPSQNGGIAPLMSWPS